MAKASPGVLRHLSASLKGDCLAALPEGAISSDIRARLEIYANLLLRWQGLINLVAPSTLPDMWPRHFADSLQILEFAPNASTWIDMGSGAGFPGLVTAIQLAGKVGACVHLIESDQRKCAFLREVSRETGAPVIVHCGRIESVLPTLAYGIAAVSARALAPLSDLIKMTSQILLTGTIGVFPKGQEVAEELTRHALDSRFEIRLLPSKSNPGSRVVIVRAASAFDIVLG